jgi:hypothetical protein
VTDPLSSNERGEFQHLIDAHIRALRALQVANDRNCRADEGERLAQRVVDAREALARWARPAHETSAQPDWKALAVNLGSAVLTYGDAKTWGFGVKRAQRELAEAVDAIRSALKAPASVSDHAPDEHGNAEGHPERRPSPDTSPQSALRSATETPSDRHDIAEQLEARGDVRTPTHNDKNADTSEVGHPSGNSPSVERMRARFEAFILRDRGMTYLQRNDPSVDAEHDYPDPFIQEAWEAWQVALAGAPSAVHTLVSTQHLRETLGDVSLWLKSALECKQWDWEPDQRLAAMACLKEADVLLRSPAETSAVQMTDMEVHAYEGQGFRAEARFKGEAVKLFAANAVQWFRDSGGENYVTTELTDPNTHESYSITMQRACGKTPAQELSELRAALQTATTAETGEECGPTP